ncbi:MAG: WD40 repeat domain-containing protein, partial [Pseudomonadota bacterium]
MTLTSDAARAVTGGLDSSLCVFDVEAGSMVLRVADAHDAAVSASALCSADTIATAALDASVKLWHLGGAACDEVVAFYDHESPATCVAARGNLVVAGADDGRVLIWDARDAGAPVGAAVLPSPVAAIALTLVTGGLLLAVLGHPPLEALWVYFVSPLLDGYSRSEVL